MGSSAKESEPERSDDMRDQMIMQFSGNGSFELCFEHN